VAGDSSAVDSDPVSSANTEAIGNKTSKANEVEYTTLRNTLIGNPLFSTFEIIDRRPLRNPGQQSLPGAGALWELRFTEVLSSRRWPPFNFPRF